MLNKMKSPDAMLIIIIYMVAAMLFSYSLSAKSDYESPKTAIKPEFGYLKVHTYSYPKEPLSFSSESAEPEGIVYAPYSIFARDKTLIKQVSSTEAHPATIRLPRGEYVIVAKMSKDKVSSFAVNIEAGQLIEVDAIMLENAISKSD